MGVFDFIHGSTNFAVEPEAEPKDSETNTSAPAATDQPSVKPASASSNADILGPSSSNPLATNLTALTSPTSDNYHRDDKVPVRLTPARGFSFRSLAFMSNRDDVKPSLSTFQEYKQEAMVSAAMARQRVKLSRSDKRAKKDALIVRSLIIGPSPITPTPKAVSKISVKKVRSQLMTPKSANKLIAQLRALPGADAKDEVEVLIRPTGPIHAVCLDVTDAEADKRHFSQLITDDDDTEAMVTSSTIPSVVTASVAKLSSIFKDIRIVSLVSSPDFGIGQPCNGEGLLSGAVPTAETIIDGVEKLTPQLMALGFATGKSIYPDHTGVYPPTDRISVLTCSCTFYFLTCVVVDLPADWWGLELCLPNDTMHYLSVRPLSLSHRKYSFHLTERRIRISHNNQLFDRNVSHVRWRQGNPSLRSLHRSICRL